MEREGVEKSRPSWPKGSYVPPSDVPTLFFTIKIFFVTHIFFRGLYILW